MTSMGRRSSLRILNAKQRNRTKMRRAIREMKGMPNDQSKHMTNTSTALSYHSSRKHQTIQNYCHGLYHKTPSIRRLQHNPHHHRHGLQQGILLHPLQRNNRLRRSCHSLHATHSAALWHTQKDHLRSQPLLHLMLWTGAMQKPGHPTEC